MGAVGGGQEVGKEHIHSGQEHTLALCQAVYQDRVQHPPGPLLQGLEDEELQLIHQEAGMGVQEQGQDGGGEGGYGEDGEEQT